MTSAMISWSWLSWKKAVGDLENEAVDQRSQTLQDSCLTLVELDSEGH